MWWTAMSSEWSEDDLAYDGSSRPQSRELTPRERDVLTRIITGWWHTLVTIDAEQRGEQPQFIGAQVEFGKWVTPVDLGPFKLTRDELIDDPRVAWMRMDPREAQMLLNLREVLTPRED